MNTIFKCTFMEMLKLSLFTMKYYQTIGLKDNGNRVIGKLNLKLVLHLSQGN